jgi:hypothetical protein
MSASVLIINGQHDVREQRTHSQPGSIWTPSSCGFFSAIHDHFVLEITDR